ncbi:MAG: hypothetical protein HQL51_12865 [Magnetococcales bacterium]|nr:hypothetical protein [Magnetococcales bacterium]
MVNRWKGMGASLVVLALLIPTAGWGAAPYCVVDAAGKHCWFQDLPSCQQAAGEKGECVLNREGMIAPVGGSPFCVMENWRTECNYSHRQECDRMAAARRASCIPNPNYAQDGSAGFGLQPRPELTPASGAEPTIAPDQNLPVTSSGGWKQRPYLPAPGYDPMPGRR